MTQCMNHYKNNFITIWAGINKNGNLALYFDRPKKDSNKGIWIGKYPYLNSIVYNNLKSMIEKTEMSWECDAEPFQVNVQKKTLLQIYIKFIHRQRQNIIQ